MSDDKIVYLETISRLDIPVERVVQGIEDNGVDELIVAGYDKDGNEYFASTYANGKDCLWILERMKQELMSFE